MECIREGCQSEALRRLSGSVQDKQCFTVVFRGARKSLDLVCPSEAEAQCWVRGLRTLKEYVANMTQKEKLDQYPPQAEPSEPSWACQVYPACILTQQKAPDRLSWSLRVYRKSGVNFAFHCVSFNLMALSNSQLVKISFPLLNTIL